MTTTTQLRLRVALKPLIEPGRSIAGIHIGETPAELRRASRHTGGLAGGDNGDLVATAHRWEWHVDAGVAVSDARGDRLYEDVWVSAPAGHARSSPAHRIVVRHGPPPAGARVTRVGTVSTVEVTADGLGQGSTLADLRHALPHGRLVVFGRPIARVVPGLAAAAPPSCSTAASCKTSRSAAGRPIRPNAARRGRHRRPVLTHEREPMTHHRLLATLLPVVALMAMPPGVEAARKQVPDLVVTKVVIKQLPGDPPYLVEDPSGHTPGFAVRATTKNIGRVVAKSSRTKLELSSLHGMSERVPKLRPRASHTTVFKVDLNATRPPLGFLRVTASADAARSVQERDEQNNTRAAPPLPVIAQQWKVLDFMTTEDLSGTSFPGALEQDFTKACWQVDCGRSFVFRFSTFDESAKVFEYAPEGTIRAGWTYLYPPLQCTGNVTDARGPKTWPGQLEIDSELDSYSGEVDVPDAERPPTRGAVACPGSPVTVPAEWAFASLVTFVGEGRKPTLPEPSATKLTGHTE